MIKKLFFVHVGSGPLISMIQDTNTTLDLNNVLLMLKLPLTKTKMLPKDF